MSQRTVEHRQQETQYPSQGADGLLQRKCACGQHNMGGGECEKCRKRQLERGHSSTLQRRAVQNHGPKMAPPIVHEVLRMPGRPLDPDTRAFMESRFARDFSQVRVHADNKAAQSAQTVKALAYTVGQHIVFGTGQYRPDRKTGRQLLAHELTHTVQQRSLASLATGETSQIPIGASRSNVEWEASSAAESITSRKVDSPPTISLNPSGPVLSRVDCSRFSYRECKAGVYNCGYGGSGTCAWVGPSRGGCICTGEARRTPSTSEVLEVLTILGLSVLLVVTVLAALADPEPASKLILAGLTLAEVTALLLLLGYSQEEVRDMGLDPELASAVLPGEGQAA